MGRSSTLFLYGVRGSDRDTERLNQFTEKYDQPLPFERRISGKFNVPVRSSHQDLEDMRLHRVIFVVWIATIITSSKSDSSGNRSNEGLPPVYSYIYEFKHDINDGQVNADVNRDNSSTTKSQNADDRVFNITWNAGTESAGSAEEDYKKIANESGKEDKSDKKVVRSANYQRRAPAQIIQPYIVHRTAESIEEDLRNPPINKTDSDPSRLTRTTPGNSNDSIFAGNSVSQELQKLKNLSDLRTPDYNPTSDKTTNDVQYTLPIGLMNIENIGGFGQRLLTLSTVGKSVRHPERVGNASFRGSTHSFINAGHYNTYEKDQVVYQPLKDATGAPTPEIIKEYLNTHYTDNNTERDPEVDDGGQHQPIGRDYKQTRYRKLKYGVEAYTSKDSLPTIAPPTSTSSGKFSGPIIVADLPKSKIPLYSSTNNYAESNSVSDAPESEVFTGKSVSPAESKKGDDSSATTSSAILSHLQVGVALAQFAKNNTFDQSTLPGSIRSDNWDDVQDTSKAEDLGERQSPEDAKFQGDQLVEQEQISEVTQKSPVESIEIQKSVEVYHTAPIQEIHYPMEYIPNAYPALGKQFYKESAFSRKPGQASSFHDTRPTQINFSLYKSNEIAVDNLNPPNGSNGDHVTGSTIEKPANKQPDPRAPGQSQVLRYQPNLQHVFDDASFQVQTIPLTNTLTQFYGQNIVNQHGNEFGKNVFKDNLQSEQIRVNQLADGLRNGYNSEDSTMQSRQVPQFITVKGIQNNSSPQVSSKVQLLVPPSYAVEKVVEKTVHIPHMIEVEKKVPYPVEKVIEKQVTIPQLFPVHIQVPVDRIVEKQVRIPQLYPIHVEKVIEKQVPYAIQRYLIQPFPIRVPQNYAVEKQVRILVPVDQPEKALHLAGSYSSDLEKSVDHRRPFPMDIVKFGRPQPPSHGYKIHINNNQQSVKQYEPKNYQPIMNPPYALRADDDNQLNDTQFNENPHNYVSSNFPLFLRQPFLHAFSKNNGINDKNYPHSGLLSYSTMFGSRSFKKQKGRGDTDAKEEYKGHLSHKMAGSLGPQTKSVQYKTPDVLLNNIVPLRRPRQEGLQSGSTGSFRQSKMEYGFKPPMVPSIQYDEKTATKVER